jgi:uncharacterized protein
MVQRQAVSGVPVAALTALVVLAAASCTSGPGPADDRPYLEQLQNQRAAKDDAFRRDKDSPIPTDARTAFAGLHYYAVDPAYRVPAFLTVEQPNPPLIIELQTSSTERQRMRKVGNLGFTLGDAAYKLTAFAESNSGSVDRLFVPFGDLTNVSETYHGGRFLDLDRTPTGLYDLDFNRAYHPYCVYNPAYICPVPPNENRLAVAIPAGEKLK